MTMAWSKIVHIVFVNQFLMPANNACYKVISEKVLYLLNMN